jgi:hypothetical protein
MAHGSLKVEELRFKKDGRPMFKAVVVGKKFQALSRESLIAKWPKSKSYF